MIPAVRYHSKVYDVEYVTGESHGLPDMIFCRRNFAMYTHTERPANLTDEYGPIFRRKTGRVTPVRLVWLERAPQHEQYKYTVWYNILVIDRLGMSRDHVDALTEMLRAHRGDDVMPSHLEGYWRALRHMVMPTYKRDIEILLERKTKVAYHLWASPIHPRLQEVIALAPAPNITVLWWAITETRYVKQYSERDTDLGNKLVQQKNLRFGCHDVDCWDGVESEWIGDHYCVMWDHQRHTIDPSRETTCYFMMKKHDEIQVSEERRAIILNCIPRHGRAMPCWRRFGWRISARHPSTNTSGSRPKCSRRTKRECCSNTTRSTSPGMTCSKCANPC